MVLYVLDGKINCLYLLSFLEQKLNFSKRLFSVNGFLKSIIFAKKHPQNILKNNIYENTISF